ncbi:MAG: ATP-binding protein [Methanoregula sp.]|jgi:PAS domain S-box-containing protein
MDLSHFLPNRDLVWYALIGTSAALALAANLIGLLNGISVVIPHLLYIPVVIGAYRYPKWGLFIAGCTGATYLLEVILVTPGAVSTMVEALVRTIVVIAIGGLIAMLSSRLRERQDLYQGLFYHSEAGTILVRDSEQGRIIEEVNDKALELLHRKSSELKGAPPVSFWSREFEQEMYIRITGEGAVHATETEFLLPDGSHETVLVSAASIPGGRTVVTFVEITRRVLAEKALKTANDKLNLLSRMSKDHLRRTVDQMAETVTNADAHCSDSAARAFLSRMRVLSVNLIHQLFLTESYKNLGTYPPVWMGVQQTLESVNPPEKTPPVSVRIWTERLEIYADPLCKDVLAHITGNAIGYGITTKNLVITYHETRDGLDLILEDDGIGIPSGKKQQIFEYDTSGNAGIGLFICRQILGVTNMTVTETGMEGKGARFVIHAPTEGYRIEGVGEAPAFVPGDTMVRGGFRGARHSSGTIVRELCSAEFPVAETLWAEYHQTKGDSLTDRIFAGFVAGEVVSVARCRRHPDGFEVDAVFTPAIHRGHGYAHAVIWGLVEACGHEPLYMHSVKDLTGFYDHFGFVIINESELPPTIRERYAWAGGNMEGADVCPMKRSPNR